MVEMDSAEVEEPPHHLTNGRVGSDGETDTNDDEPESELTIDMDAGSVTGDDDNTEDQRRHDGVVMATAECQNNNVSEQQKIREYMSRKDTAVIFPEPPAEATPAPAQDSDQAGEFGPSCS